MEANEFEKNVKREMDDFKLRPSEEVWTRVEKEISDKKRKRRIIFFLLFSAVGLMLAGYCIYHFSGNISKSPIENKLSINSKPKTTSLDKEQNDVAVKPTTFSENEEPGKKPATDKTKSKDEREEKMTTNDLLIVQKNYPNPVQRKNSKTVKKQVETQKEQNNKDALAETNIGKSSSIDQKSITDNTVQQTKPIEENVVVNNLPDSMRSTQQELKKDAVTVDNKKAKEKINSSKTIIWGIDISLGASTITENPFSFDNSKSLADVQYGAPNPSTGPGGQPNNYRGPQSQNKSAFAFKMGLHAKKNLSPRSSLSVGLSYSYLADKIEVGARQYTSSSQNQNSSLSAAFAYYANVSPQQSSSSSNSYTDQFHFIELPVIYHWRMTNNSERFLSLNLGLSPAYLLSTNALVYDTAFGGIYYSNKNLIQKTHFNIVSGLSYQFGISRDIRVSLGPQFSFDLTKIFKSGFDERKYFLFTGINAGVFFDKKKK